MTRFRVWRVTRAKSVIVHVDPAEVPDGVGADEIAAYKADDIPEELWDDVSEDVEAA